MNTSSTRLKKPLHIWLARIIGIGFILGYTWVSILSIREYKSTLNRGAIMDIYHLPDENGLEIIKYVSPKAARNGISVGDQLLNPDADSYGNIGTEATFQIQKGNQQSREVSLKRQPSDFAVYGGILLGLPSELSKSLALFLVIFSSSLLVLSALLLCWLRSDDWMALLTAATLVSFYLIPSEASSLIFLLSQILKSSAGLLIFLWLIFFPNGKLAPRWSWVLVLFMVPVDVLSLLIQSNTIPWTSKSIRIDQFNNIAEFILFLAILAIVVYRYRRVFSLVERQQSKWIIISFIIATLPVVISKLLYGHYFDSFQTDKAFLAFFINAVITGFLFHPILVLGIFFSVFKFRLYDVDVFVSRALVYSSLTGILGVVGSVTATLINSIQKQLLVENQPGTLNLVISALPIAALFNPVREGLQQIVDRYFKPEEVDFENTFIEFTSELSSFFTVKELSTLLSDQAVAQLDVSYASVFLNGPKGALKHIKTTSLDGDAKGPILDPETVEIIKSGQLAVPEGNAADSLVIPLVVPRNRKPSVLGALVLGPRLQGLGYSTEMQKNLKKFGEVAGKAIYMAELKERKRGNI